MSAEPNPRPLTTAEVVAVVHAHAIEHQLGPARATDAVLPDLNLSDEAASYFLREGLLAVLNNLNTAERHQAANSSDDDEPEKARSTRSGRYSRRQGKHPAEERHALQARYKTADGRFIALIDFSRADWTHLDGQFAAAEKTFRARRKLTQAALKALDVEGVDATNDLPEEKQDALELLARKVLA